MSRIVWFLNTSGPILLLVLAFLFIFLYKKDKLESVRLLVSVFAAGTCALVFKELFETTRPFSAELIGAGAGMTQYSSFPSMHSTISFSIATTVNFRNNKFGILLFSAAILVAIGRVVARVHYPVDVFFGVIIGVLVSYFVEYIPIKVKIRRRLDR